MEAENKNMPEAADAAPVVMEGTETMGYWDFKKEKGPARIQAFRYGSCQSGKNTCYTD